MNANTLPFLRSDIVAVTTQDPSLAGEARRLARRLRLPLATDTNGGHILELNLDCARLTLQPNPKNPGPFAGFGPVAAEFVHGAFGHRRRQAGRRHELLARATGLDGNKTFPSVLDATAGLGRDGFLLAHLGCAVTMMERAAVVAALLADGLKRAAQDAACAPAAGRVRLLPGDFLHQSDAVTPTTDVVYLDPMYPDSRASALPRKEILVLRYLAGAGSDALLLLDHALCLARHRVVVKRPAAAPPLALVPPRHSIHGSAHRFDVYMV